jgi:signal transduction histidine kinase
VLFGPWATMAGGRPQLSCRARNATVVARSFALTLAWLIGFLASPCSLAAEPRPSAILVLDQSDARSPFYSAIFAGLRSTVAKQPGTPVSVFAESLNLARFNGSVYEESFKSHLRVKYADQPPGVIVAVGAVALDFVLRSRTEFWPDVPVVFCMVDEPALVRLSPPADMTGNFVRIRFADMMTVARALVPGIQRIALVGDAWDRQTVFRHFRDEVPPATVAIEVVDLLGLPLEEVRRRAASLPARTAILFLSMVSDGAGNSLWGTEAVSRVASVANVPIVGASETFLGHGAAGGFVLLPGAIGDLAAQLAIRIIEGETPSTIAVTLADVMRPAFDWRQLQRWGVHSSNLPPGSEIRFRELTAWERYRPEIVAVAAVVLLQAVLIIGLLYQRRRRRAAEVDARQRMAELAHMNRQATVGQLSASIAHELNQPLGAILNNVEAAVMLVDGRFPNGRELKAILGDIKRDDQRASEVIKRLRHLLTPGTVDAQDIDVNEVVREVVEILSALAAARDVKLGAKLAQQRLRVKGDRVQLEQVILNLFVNGIEAIAGAPNGVREIDCRSWASDGQALISIRDSGPGIPTNHLERLFEPFFTTKGDGMGMGLCIARTIIEAHGGKISAESRPSGAVFHISLPMAKTQWA